MERILPWAAAPSIGIAKGAKGARLRRLLAPGFTAQEVDAYLPL